ncbi:MAG TPA: VCBS repeat-containing protein [Verrucomicrobiae bacterium]|nr:VCBS repeat-containing protein [Verrucomicrobiae bacterium]
MNGKRNRVFSATAWFAASVCLELAANAAINAPAGSPDWSRVSVSLPESIWSVEAVDANADGKLDLVAMGETKVFALIAPEWKPQVLIDTQEPKLLYCVALDADADGDLDIALGRYRAPWIEYREARKAGKAADEPKGPDFSIAWIENTRRVGEPWPLHAIDRELNGIHGLWTGDINGDGAKDLLADSILGPFFPKSLAWFQTPPRGGTSFERHVITKGGADGRPHYMDVADLNGDGRRDLLVGDSGGGTFTWWEQGANVDQPWIKHVIAKDDGATNIKAADINRDGVPDAVTSCGHGKGVFWFEGPAWKKHVLDGDLRDPHALAVGDFDGDGDADAATASFGVKVVRWYQNDGRGSFSARDIDTANRQEAYDLKAVDLDADGRLDLILAGRETRNAVWYRNRKPE